MDSGRGNGDKQPYVVAVWEVWEIIQFQLTICVTKSVNYTPSGPHLRICIIQSCYIPWKGFFDLIGRCDEYVVYDSAQFVKGHWHNRNRIKTVDGLKWLTMPVTTSVRLGQPIDQVEVGKPWADQHWRALELAYKRAPFFESLAP